MASGCLDGSKCVGVVKLKLVEVVRWQNGCVWLPLYLIGDSVHPLMRWFMKQFPLSTLTGKLKYCISHGCIAAENVLASLRLTGRWRHLMKTKLI